MLFNQTFSYNINQRREASQLLNCLKISPGQHATQQGELQKSTAFLFPNNLVCFHSFSLQDTSLTASNSFNHLLFCFRTNDLAHADEFARLVCTFQSQALYCSGWNLTLWNGYRDTRKRFKKEKNCRKGEQKTAETSQDQTFPSAFLLNKLVTKLYLILKVNNLPWKAI